MINYNPKSIRAFIGAKNYSESRAFYKDLGFEEIVLSSNMCLIKVNDALSFYLQDAYVKNWINNSMLFLEVDDVEKCKVDLLSRGLTEKYATVRFTEIKEEDWGKEIFMHDPSGVLWHFGQFNTTK
ncbi:glyoxalase [Aurantibacter crassamenti]|uniref:glyoxalase n=1 Tax=Aurantibacter crassamenti TaxID=1837375 RepID=UPI00193A37FA|nr:glyoxalase [Aurantibacter crassamenti]MBM1106492.1 glyoxalase [Aurantibacter crassamenti]